MSLDELIDKFLEKTRYLENDRVKAIVVYGSRVRGTNKTTSDLDVLVISDERKNFKAATKVDGIKVDYNVFSSYNICDIAYDKKMANNAYFESVLKNGIIIKDNGILSELKNYLEELNDIKPRKKKIPYMVLAELKELYDNFKSTKESFWYFNLLEKLRMTYNYLNNCSYVSMVKVYDVFSNEDFYQEAYNIKTPDTKFVSMFLNGINITEFDLQLEIVSAILMHLGINLDRDIECIEENEEFLNDNDIKGELLVIYNKVEKVIEFLKENHPFSLYAYNVLLRQIELFYQRVYRKDSVEIENAIKKIDCSNEERIAILKELFGIVDKDYHFDYDNYMLKLKL